jgi:hypothetical protein
VNLRTALSLANLAAILVAFLVLFELPQYSTDAFYALLAWIFIGFGLMYLPRRRAQPTGPTPGGDLSGTFRSPSAAPLPSASGSAARPSVDFCIYCGTTLPSGSTVCPACGHGISSI